MSLKELLLLPGLLLLPPVGAMTASAASFDIQGITPVAAVRGTSPPEMVASFSVTEAGAAQTWTASLEGNPAWASLNGTAGTGAGSLTVSFTTAALAAGTYDTALTLDSGGTVSRKAFTLTVIKPNVIRMKADFGRPAIYALHRDAGGPDYASHVIFLNTETEKVEKVLSVGNDASDFDISYPEQTLYIVNQVSPASVVRAIDLNGRTALRAMTLDMQASKVSAGVKGQIVTESGYLMALRDSLTGVMRGAVGIRPGDGETDPSGRYYYHCSDTEDWSGPKITRFDLLSSNLESAITSEIRPYGPATLLVSGDGNRVFWKSSMFDSGLKELRTFSSDITACTLRGEFVIGTGNAWNGTTGASVRTLPLSSPVAAVSGDQRKLFQFDAEAGAFISTPMSLIGTVPPVTNDPSPAVNAVVWASLPKVSWTRTPGAVSYRVFLGTDPAAVAAAGTNSPLSLGETDVPEKVLTAPLAAGTEYFWRIESVRPSGVATSPVWKFRTSPLTLQPDVLKLKLPHSTPALTYNLKTGSSTTGTWTASESASWLSLPSATGPAGSDLRVKVDTTGLDVGTQTANINVAFAGETVTVPVTLEVFILRLLKMVPDPVRPWVYGLHQGDYREPGGYVACIGSASRQVEEIIDVGIGAVDLCINHQEGRMYVAGTTPNRIQVISLETRKALSTFPCTLPPVKINAGRAGRLYIEAGDDVSNRTAQILDSATGAVIASNPGLQKCDARMDPSGRFYYRADTGNNTARLLRYDVSQDTWTTPVESAATTLTPFKDLLMSPDGSRLFWKGQVCDAGMNVLNNLGSEVYATTQRGELAVVASGMVNTRTGVSVLPLPLAKVSAITGDQSALIYWTENYGRILSVPLAGAAAAPAPGTVTQPADQSVNLMPVAALSWDAVPAAVKYRVYFGTDAAAVAAATSTSPLYLGETLNISWPLPSGAVESGSSYFWKVDVIGLSGVTAGTVKGFKTLSVTPSLPAVNHTAPAGGSPERFQLAVNGAEGTTWTASSSGAAWLNVISSAGVAGGSLELEIAPQDLAPGFYTSTVSLTANGISSSIPVDLRVVPLSLSALVADPVRPRLYAFQHSGPSLDSLLVIDTNTSKITKVVPLGADPSAMDPTPDGQFLYVYNEGAGQIQRFKPEDWTSSARAVPPTTNYSFDSTRFRIAAGEGDKVYWLDRQSGNTLKGIDFATGVPVGPGIGATPPGFSFGSIAALPGGRELAAMGSIFGGGATRVDLNGVLPSAAMSGAAVTGGGALYPVLPRADSSAVFMGKYKLDASLTQILKVFPAEILAVTPTPGLVFGRTQAWREGTMDSVWRTPDNVWIDVCAVDSTQTAFFYFNKLTAALTKVPFSSLGGFPGPQPEDGEAVRMMPSRLGWTANPEALRYEIYFGSEQAGVENAAGATGPFYLGNTAELSMPLLNQEFVPGRLWWWRVDTVLPSGTVKGVVWKFSGALKLLAELAPDTASGTTLYPNSVVMDGRTLMAGYPAAGGSTNGGKVRVYSKVPGKEEWALIQILTSPGARPDTAFFGAAIGLKGDAAWISAPGEVKIHEFRRDSLTKLWAATGRKVEPSAPSTSSAYGFGKTLAFNGSVLAVGVPDATIGQAPNGGAVDVFDASTLARQRLLEVTPWTFANYGSDIALGDGFLAAGSPTRPKSGAAYTGAVDIWTQGTGGAWNRSFTITPVAADNLKKLGNAVAASGDRLFVNAILESSRQVFAYQKTGGSSWVRTAVLPGPASSSIYDDNTIATANGDQLAFGLTNNVQLHRRTKDQSWTLTGPALPEPPKTLPGLGSVLALNPRYLSGTYPKASGASGTTPDGVAVFVHDPTGNIPPAILSAPAAYGMPGRPYRSVFTAMDENVGEILKFTAVSALPAWLSLKDHGDGTAELSGTPPAGGTASVDIQVTDSAGTTDHQKFDLRILAGDQYPAILEQTADQTVDDGQPVTLTVNVPVPSAVYQWFRNGAALAGETKASLILPHAQVSDAGIYTVRVTQGTTVVDSDPIRVTVNDAPNRFGGDWTTFGGRASRTGAYGAVLGRHKFLSAWSQPKAVSQPAVTGGGRVYTVIKEGSIEPIFTAWDPDTGTRLWSMRHSAYAINPPTWHDGKLYAQRRTPLPGDWQLLCLDAATGKQVWSTPYLDQSGNYFAPAVDDSGVYIGAGYYSGMYGFDFSGRQRFFHQQLPQVDQWTPLLHNGKLYTWLRGSFQNHNPLTGAVNYRITTSETDSPGCIPAAEGDLAVMGNAQAVYGIDLTIPRYLWQRTGSFTGSPAIKNGTAYIIAAGGVESYDARTGAPGVIYPTLSPGNQAVQSLNQPMILDDTLLVSSADTVWTFDLATGTLLQRLSGGGPLGYTNGLLMASGPDMTLRTWRVNQPAILQPTAGAEMTARVNEAFTWDLKVSDPDGDMPVITFSGLPSWLSVSPLSQGIVRFTGTPLEASASTLLNITANDGKSFPSTLPVKLTVLEAPIGAVAMSDPVFNPQTGLWEQSVRVRNNTDQTVDGFELAVSKLLTGVRLYNGSGGPMWSPFAGYYRPLAPGASVIVTLEYQAAAATQLKPVFSAAAADAPDSVPAPGAPFAISAAVMPAPNNFMLEFPSEPGALYQIQYRNGNGPWQNSLPRLRAAGTLVQWLDYGEPGTLGSPASVTSRFYRVQRLTAP